MRIGVLSNPSSRLNRKQLPQIEQLLGGYSNLDYFRLDEFKDLEVAIDRFLANDIELIAICGGDGTVSAALTQLLVNHRGTQLPQLAIVAGGTSNTIAGDVGLVGKPVTAIAELLDRAKRGSPLPQIERPILRVDYDPAKPDVCGMFFGTAAICDAILLRRRLYPQTWLPDAIAAVLTMTRVLGGMALGAETMLPAQSIRVDINDEIAEARSSLILIATTLNRILLGSAPFWGTAPGPVKLTRIASPADGLLRNIWRLLYGSNRSQLPVRTFHSHNAERFALHMDCPFNLDGEFYNAPPGYPVTLTATEPVKFVQF